MRISDWSSDVCSSDLAAPLRPRLLRRRSCSGHRRIRAAIDRQDALVHAGAGTYVLHHVDACQTTLNPGFKWERRESFGLSAARRACTPGFRCAPVVVITGQGVCLCTPSITAENAG